MVDIRENIKAEISKAQVASCAGLRVAVDHGFHDSIQHLAEARKQLQKASEALYDFWDPRNQPPLPRLYSELLRHLVDAYFACPETPAIPRANVELVVMAILPAIQDLLSKKAKQTG
jgi:hypothetical protein